MNKPLSSWMLVAIFILSMIAGCTSRRASQGGKDEGCTLDGTYHAAGDSFPAADGCNTCTCQADGTLACTRKACTPSDKPCRKTGCSGEICAEEEEISICQYREEYACYKNAVCARQADGRCGFTQTPELERCLEKTR